MSPFISILICSLCVMASRRLPVIDAAPQDSAEVADIKANDTWWRHAVFYQIYPRSFMDSNGDGVGDLRGVISRLDHLAETGITATWLSPIFKSPMVDFGYDIADFKAIHAEYGTMEDFEDLLAEAKRLGIHIILDFVPNHTSNQCEWFQKSAARVEGYEDFYVWADGRENDDGEREPPNNWPSVFHGSAWTWHEGRGQFYLHQFTIQQPDLNYHNPRVLEAMDDVMRFWLDKGVSGFRVDAINHLFEDAELRDEPISSRTNDSLAYDYTEHIYTRDLPEGFGILHHWRQLLDDYTAEHGGPTRIMMTEAYADHKRVMDYYEDAEGMQGSHIPFNFLLVDELDAASDARDFVFNIQKWLTYMPRTHVANWVLGNHDKPRIASRYLPERVDALNMLLMTLPGVAVTYNGEEIGMRDNRDISWEETMDPPACNSNPDDYQKFSRDPVRTPFQWDDSPNAGFSTAPKTWLPVHPNYVELNLAQQKATDRSHYQVYKSLVALRQRSTLRSGRFQAEVLNRNVFAYKRELKGHPTVVVVINVGAEPQTVNLAPLGDLPPTLEVLVAGSAGDHVKGSGLNTTVTWSLEPFECLVLHGRPRLSEERRALIMMLIKMANVVLVGMLLYRLGHNNWTKLSLNRKAFT